MNTLKLQSKLLDGKRVLLTGAAGFIGSHLVRALLDCNCQVVALVKPDSDLWRIQDIVNKINIVYADLGNLELDSLQSKISEIDIMYHLAASGVRESSQDVSSIMQTNIIGTWQMLNLSRTLKVERFVYCGSCFEYGGGSLISEKDFPRPLSEYGVSKSSAWLIANMFYQKYGLPVVSLRPFTVYGPFEDHYRLIPYCILNAIEDREIGLTTGEQKRDFVFIDDIVMAFLKTGVMPDIIGDTFNLATGISVSVKEVASLIIQLTGSRSKPLFGRRPYRDSEFKVLTGNPSYAKDKLNWQAEINLKEGLTKAIQWFSQNRAKYADYANKI